MKEIEVQTENKDNQIIKSSKIKINEKDDRIKVIVSVGTDYNGRVISMEMINNIHKTIVSALENDSKVITIPSFIKINTIKIW